MAQNLPYERVLGREGHTGSIHSERFRGGVGHTGSTHSDIYVMPSHKRPRESGASAAEQQNQDPPAAVPGLGALLSLVAEKVSQATASMFGRRAKKPRQDSVEDETGPAAPISADSRSSAEDEERVARIAPLPATSSVETPPHARVQNPSGAGTENLDTGHQAGGTALSVMSVGNSPSISYPGSGVCYSCGERSAGTLTPPPTTGGATFARHLLKPVVIKGGVLHVSSNGGSSAGGKGISGSIMEISNKEEARQMVGRDTEYGLPRLCDGDSLRHTLSFLEAPELARFALASSAAREFALGHASTEICRRFPRILVGIRELPPAPASPRRLFGTPTAPSASSDASNVPLGTGIARGATIGGHGQFSQLSPRLQQNQRSSGEGSTRRGGGSNGGDGRGSSRQRRVRGRGTGVLVKCGGSTGPLALAALYHLEICGDLLECQLKTLPRLDIFKTLQSRSVLGSTQFLTPHMRAVLVDWMVEVAFQFRLSTIALHAAVSALDVCLGKVAVPRCRLQLLGVVCAMIQSQAGGGCQVMTTTEAIHICDSQYNPAQVHSTFNIVVSNTQEATARTVPATSAEILHRHLMYMGEASGLKQPLSSEWGKHPEVKEACVLAGLLIDLSMLDREMFRYMPGTLAAAALFLARTTAIYYSKEEVMITPHAVVEKSNREVLRLFAEGECRPFILPEEDFEKCPFGAPGLGEFLASQPLEAAAVRKCVDRLWLVQQDFLKHMAGEPSPQEVLFRYQHMFKGIKDKFVPVGSLRLQAWLRLGIISKEQLNALLDQHLPSTMGSR